MPATQCCSHMLKAHISVMLMAWMMLFKVDCTGPIINAMVPEEICINAMVLVHWVLGSGS